MEKTMRCPTCGATINTETKECANCGYHWIDRRRITLTLSTMGVIVAFIVITFCAMFNYSRAVTAKNSQHFSEAKQYYDNLLIADKLFPDDYAYITAGVFMEKGDYLQAFYAFETLGGYEVPQTVTDSLYKGLYEAGQLHYQHLDYSEAKKYFEVIGSYQRSNDYMLLSKCHSEYRGALTNSEINRLFSLIGFEDTNSIILENEDIFMLFLDGSWSNGEFYFQFDRDNGVDCNLPISDTKDYFKFWNGRYITFGPFVEDLANLHFGFKIIDKDTIHVYCFADKGTRILFRR